MLQLLPSPIGFKIYVAPAASAVAVAVIIPLSTHMLAKFLVGLGEGGMPCAPVFRLASAILDHFDTQLLRSDGTLDRAKLREIIFSKPEEKRWLEHLLHPLIRAEVEQKLKNLSAPYCIVVIPLLFENEPYAFIDRYLVVDVDVALQIKRVQTRDKVTDTQVQSIINAQVSREHRLAKAHDVILNDGVLADLLPQVEALHKKYLTFSKHKSEQS